MKLKKKKKTDSRQEVLKALSSKSKITYEVNTVHFVSASQRNAHSIQQFIYVSLKTYLNNQEPMA